MSRNGQINIIKTDTEVPHIEKRRQTPALNHV